MTNTATSSIFDQAAAQEHADGISARYGVSQTGMAVDANYHSQVDHASRYTLRRLADENGKITRVRILKEGGKCDISYIHGELPNGQLVNITVGVEYLVWFKGLKGEFISWAKREGVFAKSLGLLDESNWSVL